MERPLSTYEKKKLSMGSVFTAQSFLLTTSSSLLILLLLLHFSQTTTSQAAIDPHQLCPPSSCGIFPNISYPFRLKGDPKHCRDGRFELACEDNVTSIYFDSHKYYVKEINYTKHGSIIRVVDASINNDDICSFPAFSAYLYNFTYFNNDFYLRHYFRYRCHIKFMSCPNPLKNLPTLFTNVTDCASYSSNSSASHTYDYIKVGYMDVSELPEMCILEKIVVTSWEFKDLKSAVSLSEIHHSLLYGFEIHVCPECRKILLHQFNKWEVFLFTGGILLVPLAILGADNLNYYHLGRMTLGPNFLSLGILLICLANLVFFTAAAKLLAVIIMVFTGMVAASVQLLHTRSTDVYTVANRTLLSAVLSDIIILAPRIVIFPFVMWFLIYKFRRRHLS